MNYAILNIKNFFTFQNVKFYFFYSNRPINSVTTFSILWAKKIAIACPTCVFLVISINMILLDIGIYVCLFFPPHAGTTFITTAVYWLTALVFMIMDYTQMPSFLMKYKIQPGKNAPPPTGKVIKVCT